MAYDYPLLGLFWTVTLFSIWTTWVFIVIWVFIDNFRRPDRSGPMKALWTFVLVFIPILGVLAYLISRPADVAPA